MADEPTLGIDLPRVESWLATETAFRAPARAIRPLAGGRSNLTFAVEDARGSRWVLRRPPVGPVAAGAHDILREARIVAAMKQEGVPVAGVVAACEDPSVTGAPFVVYDFIDGVAPISVQALESHLSMPARHGLADELVDVLWRIHAVHPPRTGRRTRVDARPYVQRLISRWTAQLVAEDCAQRELLERAGARLARSAPDQHRTTWVHGDYRLENCILDDFGRVRAVVDWELATAGDPLTDVGLLLAYWGQADDVVTALEAPTTAAPGMPTREVVRTAIEARYGVARSVLTFYETLGWWKLACIVCGVSARVRRGAISSPDRDETSFASQARRLAGEAEARVASLL